MIIFCIVSISLYLFALKFSDEITRGNMGLAHSRKLVYSYNQWGHLEYDVK